MHPLAYLHLQIHSVALSKDYTLIFQLNSYGKWEGDY